MKFQVLNEANEELRAEKTYTVLSAFMTKHPLQMQAYVSTKFKNSRILSKQCSDNLSVAQRSITVTTKSMRYVADIEDWYVLLITTSRALPETEETWTTDAEPHNQSGCIGSAV